MPSHAFCSLSRASRASRIASLASSLASLAASLAHAHSRACRPALPVFPQPFPEPPLLPAQPQPPVLLPLFPVQPQLLPLPLFPVQPQPFPVQPPPQPKSNSKIIQQLISSPLHFLYGILCCLTKNVTLFFLTGLQFMSYQLFSDADKGFLLSLLCQHT